MKVLPKIDASWTLFLDRDGVINEEKHEDYIHTWDEFVFYKAVKEAVKIFSSVFKYTIIITNQRGIGKGITKLADLELIHRNLVEALQAAGGRIDKIYFCPDVDELSSNRKPNTGMGLQAQKDFPAIDFSKTIMVGNTLSDMQFGRNLGAITVFLPTTRPEVDLKDHRIDFVFDSLIQFAKELERVKL
ncbi:MAG: HAD-IIIA family hydrolase [Ferruginibacter sp.]